MRRSWLIALVFLLLAGGGAALADEGTPTQPTTTTPTTTTPETTWEPARQLKTGELVGLNGQQVVIGRIDTVAYQKVKVKPKSPKSSKGTSTISKRLRTPIIGIYAWKVDGQGHPVPNGTVPFIQHFGGMTRVGVRHWNESATALLPIEEPRYQWFNPRKWEAKWPWFVDDPPVPSEDQRLGRVVAVLSGNQDDRSQSVVEVGPMGCGLATFPPEPGRPYPAVIGCRGGIEGGYGWSWSEPWESAQAWLEMGRYRYFLDDPAP